MKLLRAIRFDDSDTRMFERAAEIDEWLVSGATAFAGIEPAHLKGKLRQAFANGFRGVDTLGAATFASVASVEDGLASRLQAMLADRFAVRLGAPPDAAAASARDEIAFVASLCADLPVNTVLSVHRHIDEAGEVSEAFRRIERAAGGPQHARIWTVGDDGA